MLHFSLKEFPDDISMCHHVWLAILAEQENFLDYQVFQVSLHHLTKLCTVCHKTAQH